MSLDFAIDHEGLFCPKKVHSLMIIIEILPPAASILASSVADSGLCSRVNGLARHLKIKVKNINSNLFIT